MKILRDSEDTFESFFPIYYSLQFDEETKMFCLYLAVAGVFRWDHIEWDFREMLRFLIGAQPHICGPKREFPNWETDDEQDSARWEYNYYRDLSKGFDGLYLTRPFIVSSGTGRDMVISSNSGRTCTIPVKTLMAFLVAFGDDLVSVFRFDESMKSEVAEWKEVREKYTQNGGEF